METPTKEGEEGVTSHRVTGLSEELTPASSFKESGQAVASEFEPDKSTTAAKPAAASPHQEAQSGGMLGFVKSFMPGAASNSQGEAVPRAEDKLVHSQPLKDGTTAQIHTTTPPDTAVPAAIEESDRTVGAARTAIKAPVSEYAGALEGIAGQPVASDPTTKFGPALGSLTGDAPPAHGTVPAVVDAGIEVVDAVSTAAATAAATVVHTVKQAVGLEADPADDTLTGPSTGSRTPTPGVVTPIDLPKSGVVSQDKGTANIESKQAPGYMASAAGAVGDGATYVKDTVTGLIGGGGATTGGVATAGEPVASKEATKATTLSKAPAVEYEGEAATGKTTPEVVPAAKTTPAAATKPDLALAPSQDSVPLMTSEPPASAFAAGSTKAPEITEEGGNKEGQSVAQKDAQIVAQKEAAKGGGGEAAAAPKAAVGETVVAPKVEKEAAKKPATKESSGCCGCVIC